MHLARHLVEMGHEVTLLCETSDLAIPNVRTLLHRAVGSQPSGQTAVDYQLRVGIRAAEAMEGIRQRQGAPDVIIGHVGWGSLLFSKDVFPSTPALGYCEFYYRAAGADVGFDARAPVRFDDVIRLKARNFAQDSTLLGLDAGISPTQWQRAGYPQALAQRIAVVHDGIDTAFCRPDGDATFVLPDGRVLKPGDPVVTYAARNLEPYRGFPQFMHAAARLSRQDSRVMFVVAGADGAAYGPNPSDGRSWRQTLLDETGIDPSRIVFVGSLPHAELIRLFQVSAAHVYLTFPFVLSWSMLEAMASGVLLIGSATPPVEEFVTDGVNGFLTPFFDVDLLVERLAVALTAGSKLTPLRVAARETTLARANLAACLRHQSHLLGKLLRTG